MRGWIEWFARGIWRRRRGALIFLGILAAFVGLVLYQNRDYRPARTIDDPAFEQAANAVCKEKVRPLAEVRRSGGEGDADDTPENNAAKIDRVATKLEAAVAELRALPHKQQYDDDVDAWLDEFDAYVVAGRNYADALRTGDEAVYSAADDEGVKPLQAISDFARANHIDACIP